MLRVARFSKISYEQFHKDVLVCFTATDPAHMPTEDEIYYWYEHLCLPERTTTGSAGYDFRTPFACNVEAGCTVRIPTGIRAEIEPGWFLAIYPRSSLGMKYRMQLDNTTGVIDSDYYLAKNEGHIMAQITNDSKTGEIMRFDEGTRFMQGVFQPYGITVEDNTSIIRTGGIGSTGEI